MSSLLNGANTLNTNTTDQMDKTTPEERRKLVGFCEKHQEWYKFTDDPDNPESRNHPECGSKPSHKVGFQITSQRTFNATAKKLTKAQLKKMGGIGA